MAKPDHYLTRLEFASWAGCPVTTIAYQVARKLAPARVTHKGEVFIDCNHPSSVAYKAQVARRNKRPPSKPRRKRTPKAPTGVRLPPTPAPAAVDQYLATLPEDIQRSADMSLRELANLFGTDAVFLDWLKARREIEKVHGDELKNAEKTGKLVSRDLVRRGVLDPLNSMHENLLSDGSKTIAARVIAMHDAGRTEREIRQWIAKTIGTHIKGAKKKAERVLKNA